MDRPEHTTAALTAEDKLEIQELIARYNRAVDGGDADGWVETFTADGVFESLLVGVHRGRDALRAFADDFVAGSYDAWSGGQHWIGSVIIEGDRTKAEVFSYHIMYVPVENEVRGVLMAAHQDEAVLTDDGWRFSLRRLIPWPPGSDRHRWDPPAANE
jgi:uncharacterized protein (TIGR02246 family)